MFNRKNKYILSYTFEEISHIKIDKIVIVENTTGDIETQSIIIYTTSETLLNLFKVELKTIYIDM